MNSADRRQRPRLGREYRTVDLFGVFHDELLAVQPTPPDDRHRLNFGRPVGEPSASGRLELLSVGSAKHLGHVPTMRATPTRPSCASTRSPRVDAEE